MTLSIPRVLPLLRNTSLLMLTRIAGSAIGLLFWTLAARLVPATPLGIATGAVSAAFLLSGLAQLGLGYGLVKYVVPQPATNGIISLGLFLTGLAASILVALFLAGLPFWSPDLLPLRASVGLLLLFASLVVGTSLSQLLHWLFLAKGRLEFSLAKQSGQSLAAVLLLITLRSHLDGAMLPLLAYTIATLSALLVGLFWFLPSSQPGFRLSATVEHRLRRSFARFSLANYLSDQFQRSPDALLPLLFIYLFGPEAGACFFVAWGLGRAINALAGSVAESFFAEGVREPTCVSHHVRQAALFGGGIAVALALLVNLATPWLLSAYGRVYVVQGASTLRLVALAAIPGIWLLLLVNILRLQGRLRALNLIIAGNSCLGIALSYLCMNQFGYAGAGTGWLASQMICLTLALLWYRWKLATPPKQANLVPEAAGELGR